MIALPLFGPHFERLLVFLGLTDHRFLRLVQGFLGPLADIVGLLLGHPQEFFRR
jgi:hypothetical protein